MDINVFYLNIGDIKQVHSLNSNDIQYSVQYGIAIQDEDNSDLVIYDNYGNEFQIESTQYFSDGAIFIKPSNWVSTK